MKNIISPKFSIFLTVFLVFGNTRLVLAVDKFFQTCAVPKTCGNQNISFPFYIQRIQEDYCGYPGFQISCDSNGRPILNLSGDGYVIHRIFYENQSLIVSNVAFLSIQNRGRSCIPSVRSLSFDGDKFELASNESKAVSLYNKCNTSSLGADLLKYRIGCSAENEADSVLALPGNDETELANATDKCGAEGGPVAVPVLGYHEGATAPEVLRKGFMLKWTASDCSFCSATGGKCGFDHYSYHFKCFCPDRPHAARCDPPGNNKLALKLGLGLGLPLGAVICLVTGFCLHRWYIKRRIASNIPSRSISDPYMNSDPEAGSVYYGVPVFSYKDLEEATNNFDSKKELGDGGFGAVYHGVLKDGRDVAIKRLYEHNYRRVEQFMNEIEILTRLRHKNLVTLYGCTSRRCRELLLVYEYIPNGTVADHLHGDRAQTSPLTWPIRMSIAIETATALAYLHASEIVHRDVKTSNILLDRNFCVKVADFGLSKLFPNDVTHVTTAPQGTPGYVDPEYHQCYQLTSKSDVYSFGVVLVELISSMPAVDITRHRHEINLSNLAISKIQKRAYNELIDPRLGFDSDSEARRMTIAVAQLAFQCLQQDKEMRPTMDEVLEELKRIESGKNEVENGEAFDSVTMCTTRLPPSPDCDEVGLLKNVKAEPPSPNAVTEKWPSSGSTTPNISG